MMDIEEGIIKIFCNIAAQNAKIDPISGICCGCQFFRLSAVPVLEKENIISCTRDGITMGEELVVRIPVNR
jgi:hypothetical protein